MCPQRPAELEDFLNRRVYHPLAWRLARLLASTPITPNMVSATGAALIVLAAGLYSLPWAWLSVLTGFALHLGWHVVDGADGDLARQTGRSGPRGELVDGLCDIGGHIVLYIVLGSIAAAQIGSTGWALMWAAGISRLAQAAHYEGTRRQYQKIVYHTDWLGSSNAADHAPASRNPLVWLYRGVAAIVAPHNRALLQAQNDDRLRNAVRIRAAELLRPLGPLGANYRTIAIGLAMLANRPQWFFLFEAIVLNAVLVCSLVNTRRTVRAALAAADHRASTRR
jgi:phosphatidylglycerophosphate synthase